MHLKKAKWIEIAMTVILLAAVFVLSEKAAVSVMKVREEKPSEETETVTERTDTEKEKKICIVVDCGHGGADPGKVGVNDALEKDINLAIGQKLKKELEDEKIEVIMTRENDNGLYSEDAESKKSQDMKRRCAIIDEHMPVFTVSIHQNSYHEEYVKGAQVFYYSHSDDGKKLAETLQAKLVEHLDPENTRKPKANDSYYLLVHTKSPTVIVECGFLSNREEAALLIQDSYQTKAAQAICEGIMEYLDNYD